MEAEKREAAQKVDDDDDDDNDDDDIGNFFQLTAFLWKLILHHSLIEELKWTQAAFGNLIAF